MKKLNTAINTQISGVAMMLVGVALVAEHVIKATG